MSNSAAAGCESLHTNLLVCLLQNTWCSRYQWSQCWPQLRDNSSGSSKAFFHQLGCKKEAYLRSVCASTRPRLWSRTLILMISGSFQLHLQTKARAVGLIKHDEYANSTHWLLQTVKSSPRRSALSQRVSLWLGAPSTFASEWSFRGCLPARELAPGANNSSQTFE